MSEIVITRTAQIFIDSEGFLRVSILENANISLADAIENVVAAEALSAPSKRLLLCDVRARHSISRQARGYLADHGEVCGIAMVIGSPVSRLLGTAYVAILPPRVPTRLFTSIESALVWLRTLAAKVAHTSTT